MISTHSAEQIINENQLLHQMKSVGLFDALGFELAQEVISDRQYPPIDRVMMDGVAVSYRTYSEGMLSYKIAGIAKAGEAQKILSNPSDCLEVMTGAPLPENASLVIPYEEIEIADEIATIKTNKHYQHFQNIHAKGSDTALGEMILKPGQKIRPAEIGIAASFGYRELWVKLRPSIAIISTGDELVELNQTPKDHELRRSNVYAIKAALNLHGYSEISVFHLDDDKEKIKEHYLNYNQKFQMMIYSGGVSKGKFDFLPEVWSECGVQCLFHGVKQRPGKPLWFGIDPKSKNQIVGLPGNPISSLVCLYRYFLNLKPVPVKLARPITFHPELTYFVPVTIDYSDSGEIWASAQTAKNSGEFVALANTDGFIELPAQQSQFNQGECFHFFSWGLK